jgi:hypothetical protein
MVTAVSREVLPDRPILQSPFPRLTYEEAMSRYGSDKPDLRFGMELMDLGTAVSGVDFRIFTEALAAGGAVYAIRAPGCGSYSRRQLDNGRLHPTRPGLNPPLGAPDGSCTGRSPSSCPDPVAGDSGPMGRGRRPAPRRG